MHCHPYLVIIAFIKPMISRNQHQRNGGCSVEEKTMVVFFWEKTGSDGTWCFRVCRAGRRGIGGNLVYFPVWLRASSGPLCTEHHLRAALALLWCLGMPELPRENLSRGWTSWPILGWAGPTMVVSATHV